MRNIRFKVTFGSFILLILLIITMFFGAFNIYRRSLETVIMESMQNTAEDASWYLKNFIDGYLAPLEELADDSLVKTMDWELQLGVISKQINPNYENVAVIDMNGKAHYIDGDEIDLSDCVYIQNSLAGERSISEVIVSRKTGKKVIVAAVPIILDEKVVGSLMARLDMSLLQQYISSRNNDSTNESFIISNQGSVVMSSQNYLDANDENIFNLASLRSDYNELSNFIKLNQNNMSGNGEFTFRETDFYAYFNAIPGTNWKIYIAISKQIVLSKLKKVLILLSVIGFLIALISLAFTWRMIKKYTDPVLELNQLVEQGAKGDFSVHFVPTTNDEIAHLGMSFNQLMETIQRLTYFDPITLALNRNILKSDLKAYDPMDERHHFTLVMIQVDRLQMIKEVHGYEVSDAILKHMVERIAKRIFEQDRIYRFDDDSLVVMLKRNLSASSYEDHEYQVSRNIADFLDEPYKVNSKLINVEFNIGVYNRREDNAHEDPILSVLAATNYAKHNENQSHRIVVFDSQTHSLFDMQKNFVNELYRAVRLDEFVLVYQPLYNLKDNSMAKMEALIRWEHPEKGLIYPDAFIGIAEMSDVIIQIDFWVMEEACRVLSMWGKNEMKSKPISVNVTAKTFESRYFLQKVDELLSKYEITSGMLEFEITERVVIRNIDDNINLLKQLKQRGIKISIDDFGIGYSSLSYLVQLPIDSVKIDRSFIEQMSYSKPAEIIVSTIINLCKSLDLQVIAEGIEQEYELAYLKKNKCDIGQGYYFSKPVLLEEIQRELEY
ncbi:bifunctional diguanylate cyclase/phosphodiesterase [Fusibacter bizertensis]